MALTTRQKRKHRRNKALHDQSCVSPTVVAATDTQVGVQREINLRDVEPAQSKLAYALGSINQQNIKGELDN